MKKTRLLVSVLFGLIIGFLTWNAQEKNMEDVAGNGMTGLYLIAMSYAASQGFTKGQYLKTFKNDDSKTLEG